MALTPLAVFLEEEKARTGLSWIEIQDKTGESDSNIGRLRAGQEAKPSQLAKFAKVFDRPFWYVVQRAGYTTENPNDPSAEARRLGAVFADTPELNTLATLIERLSPENRQAVLRMVRSLLGE